MKKLDKMQMDALRELASISSGNASTALSKLTGKLVKVTTSQINIVEIKNLPKGVGGSKKMVSGAYTQVTGDISGNMLILFPRPTALIISDLVQKKELGITEVIREKEQDALIEVGNILSSSYLDTFNSFLGIEITHSKPRFISIFGESVVDFALLRARGELKYVLLLKTKFIINPPKVEVHCILLLAVKSLDLLLKLIEKKLGKR